MLQMTDFSINDTQLLARAPGPVAGTKLLHDFGNLSVSTVTNEASGAIVPGLFTALNTMTNDVQLWDSDGTAAGTQMVVESGATYNTFTFTEDGAGDLFAIAVVTSTNDTELLLITP